MPWGSLKEAEDDRETEEALLACSRRQGSGGCHRACRRSRRPCAGGGGGDAGAGGGCCCGGVEGEGRGSDGVAPAPKPANAVRRWTSWPFRAESLLGARG